VRGAIVPKAPAHTLPLVGRAGEGVATPTNPAFPAARPPQIARVASFSQAFTSSVTLGPISFHTRLW
jgi:hypothetical protein